jgi:hypothetical protein
MIIIPIPALRNQPIRLKMPMVNRGVLLIIMAMEQPRKQHIQQIIMDKRPRPHKIQTGVKQSEQAVQMEAGL